MAQSKILCPSIHSLSSNSSICSRVQDCAYKTSYLSTLYWVDQMDEVVAARMKAIINDLLQMVKPYSPEIIRPYIRVLRASKSLPFNNFEIGGLVASFVDSILPIGSTNLLRPELIFLIAFLMDPLLPNRVMNAKVKAEAIGSEIIHSLISSLTVGGMYQGTANERNTLLGDFKAKTNEVKAEVRKFYVQNADSSRHHFPITNALGFLDLLVENFGKLKDTLLSKANYTTFTVDQLVTLEKELVSLRPFLDFEKLKDTLMSMENYTTFTVDQLVTLQKELVSLRPFLKKVKELQNQLEEFKDLWMRVNDIVYQAEYVIDSCQLAEVPFWYNVICLYDLIEDMRYIKREIREIMHKQTWNMEVLNAEVNSGNIHLNQSNPLRPDEVVVGFEVEEETIINRLTRGSMKLDIVSIVGMPGHGKTTLAKKVYNSPSVRYHFNRCGWCFVSQVHEEQMLLLNILRDVATTLDDKIHSMSKDDLSHELYKCLKGQRYLIIMDDIWDITAWNALRESFPNDNNGSRILFTSRNDFGCNPLLLRPLSEEKSMELLKHKLFFKDGWPSRLSSDAQKMLKICNGLPLAIVVVAGLLNRASNNLGLWRQTVRNLDSKLACEGCVDILELSYNHLPEFLKPCFLYLGVVGQTKVFKVQNLIQLWIAEGFVRKTGIKSFEDEAMEYLEGLIGRSLVIVNKRSFASGEVKECRIHDLLHEFCLRKSQEEKFMYFSEASPFSLKPINYEQYRLCFRGRMANAWTKNTSPIVRSLLFHSSAYQPATSWFLSLRLLRVLDLGNIYFYRNFPEEIVSLIFLRYLAILCDARVIPSSIGNLRNLECFHMAIKDYILELPQTIWNMKALRNMAVVGRGAFVLNDCDADMCAHLDNLDSLSSLYLSNIEEAEKLLRRFPSVRKLKLAFSESWDCARNCNQFQVFHFLSKLESLNLQFPGKALHSCAFNFPSALKKLTLSGLRCPWNKLSTIGKLPNLEVLKFLNFAILEERWDVGDDEYLKLKYLKLSRLNISYWESLDSSFPCLERIVVRDCPFLVELPSIFVDVITLKMIEIHWCPRGLGTSAKRILNEQRDIGNEDLEVLISNAHGDRYQYIRTQMAFNDFDHHPQYFPWCMEEIEVDHPIIQERLELDKKAVLRSVACFKKRCVANVRRTNFIVKQNCQQRHAIVSRHIKEELKRDG